MAASLEFREVSKTYPGSEEPAIQSLSLEVPAGDICVLVGPSGCGKTTAMRLVNRMVPLTSGDILLDGRSVMDRKPYELRREIGYAIQQIGLFPHETVADNIATVPKLLGWPKEKIRDRVRELLDMVSLPQEMAERYPAQLSGGQRQRIGVARALASDPEVMLMDEPFGAIDPITRDRLQNEFLRLQGELGKTIVFVTHDIDEAIKLGDQVAVLRVGGKLAQLAAPHELLSHPVDAFVAGFVGRDRGYRALGFTRSSSLPAHDEPSVTIGDAAPGGDDLVLVLNAEREPQGWVSGATGTVEESDLLRGGTLATQGGTLRAALDACLSSPSGRGVVVDEQGRLIGTVGAREVLDLIESEVART